MKIELRQWYYGDELKLIDLYNRYDRSYTDFVHPAPGECTQSEANYRIRGYVDMLYDGIGFSRAVVVDDKVAGHAQIRRCNDLYDALCTMEIFLLPEVCGHGVGTQVAKEMMDYAFNGHYNFDGIIAYIADGNKAAIRICEKLGLTYRGSEEDESIINGKRCHKGIYAFRRPKKELRNTGIELKPFEPRDIDALAHLIETADKRFDEVPDPLADYNRWGQEELTPEEKQRRTIYKMREYIDGWNVSERDGGDIYRAVVNNGEIVGLISLSMQYGRRALDGRIGYIMMPEHTGKGIMSHALPLMLHEVFDLRRLHRVSASVYRPNVASIKVLERNGFRLEGVLRGGVMCDGEPTDYLFYGLLRDEFNNDKSQPRQSSLYPNPSKL